VKKIFLFVTIFVQIIACSKNNSTGGNPPTSSCRIVKVDVTPYTPDYFVLKYDDAGKLVAIDDGPGGNYKREIIYGDHNYTLNEYNGPSLIRSAKGDLTNDDKLIQYTEKQFEAGILRHTVTRTFTYYASGELKRMQTGIDSVALFFATDYDWLNGNLKHDMTNGKIGPPLEPTLHTTYEYGTQENLNGFDITRFSELMQFGRFLIKNKNPLLKQTWSQQNVNDYSSEFTYEFDAKGNISKITATRSNNAPYTMAYTYDCD
jgi:hypothetical protein